MEIKSFNFFAFFQKIMNVNSQLSFGKSQKFNFCHDILTFERLGKVHYTNFHHNF